MEKKTVGFLVALVVIAAFAIGVAYLGMSQLNPRGEGILGATVGKSTNIENFAALSDAEKAKLLEKYSLVPNGKVETTYEMTDGIRIQYSRQDFSLVPKDGSSPILDAPICCVTACSGGNQCYPVSGCIPQPDGTCGQASCNSAGGPGCSLSYCRGCYARKPRSAS